MRDFKSVIGLSLGLGLASFLLVPAVAKAATLPAEINSNYIITESIKLENDVTVKERMSLNIDPTLADDIVIDLNGHTIAKEGQSNYALSNLNKNMTVTVKGGKITCTSTYSSCVRNYGKMVLDNMDIDANFTALKNEELSEVKVNSSTIQSKWAENNEGAGTIMNYGKALIENSTIKQPKSTAIFALTYQNYSSEIVIKNSVIEAEQAVQTYYDDGSSKPIDAKANVTIDGGTISEGAIINIREIDGQPKNGELKVTGTVKAPLSVLPYAQQGSSITLYENEDVENVSVPEGVNVKVEGNKQIIVNEDGTITAVENADYRKVEEALDKAEKIDTSKYTPESVEVLNDAIDAVQIGLSINEQSQVDKMAQDIEKAIKELKLIPAEPEKNEPEKNEPEKEANEPVKEDMQTIKEDNEPEKSVQTGDNVIFYGIIAILSISGLSIATKKILL